MNLQKCKIEVSKVYKELKAGFDKERNELYRELKGLASKEELKSTIKIEKSIPKAVSITKFLQEQTPILIPGPKVLSNSEKTPEKTSKK